MAENFPEDTEEHIVQVVLAIINAVRTNTQAKHIYSSNLDSFTFKSGL